MLRPAGAAFASVMLLAGLASTHAAEPVRVTGELTYKNFPRFEAYLLKAGTASVELDLTMAIDNDETDGHLTTFVLDGQFEIAHLKPGKPTRIYADAGFELVDAQDRYTFAGVFTVDADDESIGLNFVDTLPADPATTISIDKLPAATGN